MFGLKSFFVLLSLLISNADLLAQDDNMINAIELNCALATYSSRLSNRFVNVNKFGLKYKRVFYQNDINTFSGGLSCQYNLLDYSDSFPEDDFFSYYDLYSNQNFYSIAALVNNRFSLRLKELAIFMDVELAGHYQWFDRIETRLTKQAYESYMMGNEFELNDDFALSKIIGFFEIKPGVELVKNKYAYFISLGWSKNINSIFINSVLHPNIPALEDLQLDFFSINLGFRH